MDSDRISNDRCRIKFTNIYPWGPIANLFGGMTWLIVSIMWREAALITTNIVLATITFIGLIYTYTH